MFDQYLSEFILNDFPSLEDTTVLFRLLHILGTLTLNEYFLKSCLASLNNNFNLLPLVLIVSIKSNLGVTDLLYLCVNILKVFIMSPLYLLYTSVGNFKYFKRSMYDKFLNFEINFVALL